MSDYYVKLSKFEKSSISFDVEKGKETFFLPNVDCLDFDIMRKELFGDKKAGIAQVLLVDCGQSSELIEIASLSDKNIKDALESVDLVLSEKEYADYLLRNPGALPAYGKIAILKLLYVGKGVRGEGTGSRALRKIADFLSRDLSANFLMVRPFPIELSSPRPEFKLKKIKHAMRSLFSFYERIGFEKTGQDKYEKGVLVRHMILKIENKASKNDAGNSNGA